MNKQQLITELQTKGLHLVDRQLDHKIGVNGRKGGAGSSDHKAIVSGLQLTDSRVGLQQALSSYSFSTDGATGKIQFRKTGDRAGRGILVKVELGNQSGTGYDFVPIPDTRR